MTKILLVEDDADITAALGEFLRKEGYAVIAAPGQRDAMSLLEERGADLALVDVSLRDGNGFSVCREVKEKYGIPVIFLTALSDEASAVTGFDLGADDYIAKPFRPRELLCRIKNTLRHSRGETLLRLGDLTADTARGIVKKGDREIPLSALEYRLLLTFMSRPGGLFTREQLLDAVWDMSGEYVGDNTLTVYIKRLREKIEDDPASPRYIKTARGLGYKAGE